MHRVWYSEEPKVVTKGVVGWDSQTGGWVEGGGGPPQKKSLTSWIAPESLCNGAIMGNLVTSLGESHN